MTPQDEIALDIVQFTLDLAGIIEPTPVSDGANALISLGRREWLMAGISVVSMIPYVGDLAKFGKLPKYARSISEAIRLAARDQRFAETLRPALRKLLQLLEKIPTSALPATVSQKLGQIQREIVAFLRVGEIAPNIFKPFMDFPRFEGKSIKEIMNWLRAHGFQEVQRPTVTAIGKTKQSQIWFRRHAVKDGPDLIEAVRIDSRGHAVPANIQRQGEIPHRFAIEKVASGEPRHIHKELIDSTLESQYRGGGIKKNGKHWTPPSFTDSNSVATGHADSHIWIVP